jgi:replicative DNA helicase
MIQNDIILNLLNNGTYYNKYIYKVDPSSFDDAFKVIMNKILLYNNKYDKKPSISEIKTEVIEDIKIDDSLIQDISKILNQKYNPNDYSDEWLREKTQKHIKEYRIEQAIGKCIELQSSGNSNQYNYLEIMEDALNINFDETTGYDYAENMIERFEDYKKVEEQFSFPIKQLNDMTDGGVKKKTLNAVLSGTGVGKSLFLCNFAKHYYEKGLNTVYVTLEMDPAEISKRIDAAKFNIPQNDLKDLGLDKVEKMKLKLDVQHKNNYLRIEEYPTGTACANDIKNLITNIENEIGQKVDILLVDYIGIMTTNGAEPASLYEKGKKIAEELRGLGQILDIPILTAQQLNRQGAQSSSVGTTDVAESYGLSQTCDLMIGLIEDDELRGRGEIRCQQIKNRYNSMVSNSSFLLNVDKAMAKVFDDGVNINLNQNSDRVSHVISNVGQHQNSNITF